MVGARSAVFAPTRKLGLIVIDEEHETSFKQESTPRYHARDVAVMRARLEGIPILMGSATPSLESWSNAARGNYTLLSMPSRVEDRPLRAAQAEPDALGQLLEEGLLVVEVPVEEALGDAGRPHDVDDARLGVAPLGEQLRRPVEELLLALHALRGEAPVRFHGVNLPRP